MSSLFGKPAAAPADTAVRKQQVMDEVKQQLAVANAQELINKMNEKCYAKCVLKPGSSLSSSEESCLQRCSDRYLEAFNVVSRSYVARVAREREQAGAAPELL